MDEAETSGIVAARPIGRAPQRPSASNGADHPDVMRDALERLHTFARLDPNWDSYGADPISTAAIHQAQSLLSSVAGWASSASSDDLPPFAVAQVAHGGVLLEWRRQGEAIEVELDADGKMSYLIVHPEGAPSRFEENEDPTGDDVLQAIARVTMPAAGG